MMTTQLQIFLCLMGVVIISTFFLYWNPSYLPNYVTTDYENEDADEGIPPFTSKVELQRELEEIYNMIHDASLQSRSAKTILELDNSLVLLKDALKIIGVDDVKLKTAVKPPNLPEASKTLEVCPEKFVLHYDVFYIDGIPVDPDCHTAPPLHTVLTVVMNFVNEAKVRDVHTLLSDISQSRYRNISVLAIFDKTYKTSPLESKFKNKVPHLKLVNTDKTSHHQVLNEVIKHIETKYLILTRDMERYDNFSTIDGLMRPISYGKADVVAASHRNGTGHWRAGCYQSKMVEYGYRLVEGYDLSYNGCMYCDYVSGPFAVKKDLLAHYLKQVSEEFSGDMLYMDFFTILYNDKKIVMSAVDCMFYSFTSGLQVMNKNKWLGYAKKYKINKFIFPDGEKFNFGCAELSLSCRMPSKNTLPLCCHDELTVFMNFIAHALDKNKVKFEVETELKDHNNVIVHAVINDAQLKKVKELFEHNAGYKWEDLGGYVKVAASSWNMKLYVKAQLSNEKLDGEEYEESTKILIGDVWTSTVINPGVFSEKRNQNWSNCYKLDCGNFVTNHGNLEVQDIWV